MALHEYWVMNLLRKWLAWLSRFLLAVTLSAFGCEMIVSRLVPNVNLQMAPLFHAGRLGLELKPGAQVHLKTQEFDVSVSIDPQGQRSTCLELSGPIDLVLLGDSFAFGCWSRAGHHWADILAQSRGRRLVNFGMPGVGTDWQLARLKATSLLRTAGGSRLILGFFVGNDFCDNLIGYQNLKLADGLLTLSPEGRRNLGLKAEHSSRPDTVVPVWGWLRRTHLYQLFASKQNLEFGLPLNPRSTEYWLQRSLTPQMTSAVGNTYKYLDEIHKLSCENNVEMTLVVIPSRVQVSDVAWAAHAPEIRKKWDRTQPQQWLSEWAARRGVDFLDLLPELARPEVRELTYFQRDIHWTDFGHQIAARAVLSHCYGNPKNVRR